MLVANKVFSLSLLCNVCVSLALERRLLDWVLSHWAHFTVRRLIYLCLSLCILCVFVLYCIVVVLL